MEEHSFIYGKFLRNKRTLRKDYIQIQGKTDDKDSNHYGAYSEEITVKTPDHTVEVINGMSYVDGVLLANKTYSLPASYDPKGLTKETSAAFEKMQTAAYKDGISLWVCSGYRSYYDQRYLYNMYCNRDGKAAADTPQDPATATIRRAWQ